jgi:hypothetical protein
MDAFPAVTSLQCVNALLALGFEIVNADQERTRLSRADGRRVFVPMGKILAPDDVRIVLLVADVSCEDFIAKIAEGGSQSTMRFERPEATSGIRTRPGVVDAAMSGAAPAAQTGDTRKPRGS